jgi:hypothetical protein
MYRYVNNESEKGGRNKELHKRERELHERVEINRERVWGGEKFNERVKELITYSDFSPVRLPNARILRCNSLKIFYSEEKDWAWHKARHSPLHKIEMH